MKTIPAEIAIQNAIAAVEEAGAHELLTDAVTLLVQARERVAQFFSKGECRLANPEARCDDCGGPNVWWFTASDLWNKVVRVADRPDPMLCPRCFVIRAGAVGIDGHWKIGPETFSVDEAMNEKRWITGSAGVSPFGRWEESAAKTQSTKNAKLASTRVKGNMQTPTQLVESAERSLDKIERELTKLKAQYSRSTLAVIQHELRVVHEKTLELDRMLREAKID